VRVLFDQGTPAPLRRLLIRHDVTTAYERGWSMLKNGELLAAAEAEGLQVLVTTDTKLRYQQNLAGRAIAVVVLSTTSWPRIQLAGDAIARAVDAAVPGSFAEVTIP
jgi:hypothetical protein